MSKRITIQLIGAADAERLRLQDFLDQLETVKKALRETERSVSGEDDSVLEYQVVDLSHASPFTVVIEAVPANGSPEAPALIPRVVKTFGDELRLIRTRGKLLRDPDLARLSMYQQIGVTKKNQIGKVMIKAGRSRVTVDETFKQKLDKIVGPDQLADGTISGMLEAVNFHNTNRFTIYPPLGPKRVAGNFPQDLRARVKEAIGSFVTVSGILRYKSWSPYPHGVVAREIDVHEPESELPTLSDVRGVLRGSTGNLNSAEFIDNLRHEDW
jgi:hypothetical protein